MILSQNIWNNVYLKYILKDFKGDIFYYDEIDLINNKDEFISNILNKSLFEDKKNIIISQIKISIPTYKKNSLPSSLKKRPITKPGSRFI